MNVSKSLTIRLMLSAVLSFNLIPAASMYASQPAAAAEAGKSRHITVLEPVPLYDDYTRPGTSVGAVGALQTLTVKEVVNSNTGARSAAWYLVGTWLGDKWLRGDERVVWGTYEPQEQKLTTRSELPLYGQWNGPAEGSISMQQVRSIGHLHYCSMSGSLLEPPPECGNDAYLVETWAGPKWLMNPPLVEDLPEEAYTAEFTILEQVPFFDQPASADFNLPFTLDYVQPSKVQVTARKVLNENVIWYKIRLPEGDKWILPMGRTLDNVQPVSATIQLPTGARLCENPNLECFFSNESAGPGAYEAAEQWNDWYLIRTDRGMKWVNPPEALRERPLGIQPANEQVQLLATTTTYRTPDTKGVAGHLAGFFAPQYVDAFEKWTSPSGEQWYRVHTSETQEWVREQDVQIPLYPVVKDGKYGYIDQRGNVRIPLQYDAAMEFAEGLAAVRMTSGGGWSYIDSRGKEVIPGPFREAGAFADGRALVSVTTASNGTRQGYTDRQGRFIDTPELLSASPFAEGKAAVAAKGQSSRGEGAVFGYIDLQGRVAVEPRFDTAAPFSWHLARVGMNQKYGFIQEDGSAATEMEYDDARDFHQGTAAVKAGELWGYLWSSGSWRIPPQFEGAGDYSEELAAVKKDGKWGFIDASGTMVIPAVFDEAGAFSEGLAAVRLGERQWGYIDTSGTMVIPPSYNRAEPFRAGLARVSGGKETESADYGYIDRSGQVIWKPTH